MMFRGRVEEAAYMSVDKGSLRLAIRTDAIHPSDKSARF